MEVLCVPWFCNLTVLHTVGWVLLSGCWRETVLCTEKSPWPGLGDSSTSQHSSVDDSKFLEKLPAAF